MNLRKILIGSLLGISVIATAQKITWGKEFVDNTGAQVNTIIGYDANGFFVTRYSNSHSGAINASYPPTTILEKYDFIGNQLYSKELTVKDDGGKDEYLSDGLFYMKDNMLLVMYAPDVKSAFAFRVNSDGSIDKNKTPIGIVENKWKKEILASNRYSFVVSGDKNVLLAYYRKENQNKVNISAVKEDLSVLWTKEIDVPALSIVSAALSGDNAYFLMVSSDGKTNSFTILQYNHTTNSIKKTEANPVEGKYTKDVDFRIDNAGNVLFTGIYENIKDNGCVGCFLMKIDNNSGQVSLNKTYTFSDDILSVYQNASSLKKGKGMEGLWVKDVISKDDKSVIIALEQSANSRMSGFQTGGSSMASFDYDDALIMKINVDGSLAWMKHIIKRQDMSSGKSTAPFICSFGMSILGDKMYLIFNDSKKNVQLSADDIAKNKGNVKMAYLDGGISNQALMLETIDMSSGELKRKPLGNPYENGKLFIYSSFSLPLQDKVIVYRSDIFKGNKDAGQFGQFIVQ